VTLVFERPKLASAAFVVEPRRDAAALLDTAALLDALRRTTTAVPTFASRLGAPVMSSAVDDVIGKLESMTVDEVMEKLKSEAEAGSMTLLEAKELVQAIEKTFDVDASAGAAVMMAAPMPGAAEGDAPAAEEKTEFDLVLEAFPADKKIAVLKIVRELTGAGLKDAKEMVEKAPCTLKEGASKAECEEAKAKLEEAGATVQLK
jgi:large subunit ribosomal protein L7/L12